MTASPASSSRGSAVRLAPARATSSVATLAEVAASSNVLQYLQLKDYGLPPRDALHAATKQAIRQGGVHTGEVIEFRRAGARCPRCGAEMTRATVGGRTTWWCPKEQQ